MKTPGRLFPWVSRLAEPQQVRLAGLWCAYRDLKRQVAQHGMPVPMPLARKWTRFSARTIRELLLEPDVLKPILIGDTKFLPAKLVSQHLKDAASRRAWSDYEDLAKRYGVLLPAAQAAELLNTGRWRVKPFIKTQLLVPVPIKGERFISGNSVEKCANTKVWPPPRYPDAWTPAEDKLLGTRIDRQVAKVLGRTPVAVAMRRQELGIPPCERSHPWPPEQNKLLGTAPDSKVAGILGVCAATVGHYRRKLGILDWRTRNLLPKAEATRKERRGKRSRGWTPEQEALLGTDTDANVARMLGRSYLSVRGHRISLGIISWWTRKRMLKLAKTDNTTNANL